MKTRRLPLLALVLVSLSIAGCGPSAAEITATAAASRAQTETAAPTATPSRTPTPTATPTPLPTHTPTSTATPTPQPVSACKVRTSVWGQIVYEDGTLPADMIVMLLDKYGLGAMSVTDSQGCYGFDDMPPGTYAVTYMVTLPDGTPLVESTDYFDVKDGQPVQQDILIAK